MERSQVRRQSAAYQPAALTATSKLAVRAVDTFCPDVMAARARCAAVMRLLRDLLRGASAILDRPSSSTANQVVVAGDSYTVGARGRRINHSVSGPPGTGVVERPTPLRFYSASCLSPGTPTARVDAGRERSHHRRDVHNRTRITSAAIAEPDV
jgi:hypothetical protein